jgi:hypothetical protein
VKANQSFEGAKGAAKQAKASVKAAVAKKWLLKVWIRRALSYRDGHHL